MILSEDKLQIAYLQWLAKNYPEERECTYHIPNGKRIGGKIGMMLKRMGVLPGVADLYFMRHHLYLEFKKSTKEKLSEKQIQFSMYAGETGHHYRVAHSLEEAVLITEKFFKNEGKLNGRPILQL